MKDKKRDLAFVHVTAVELWHISSRRVSPQNKEKCHPLTTLCGRRFHYRILFHVTSTAHYCPLPSGLYSSGTAFIVVVVVIIDWMRLAAGAGNVRSFIIKTAASWQQDGFGDVWLWVVKLLRCWTPASIGPEREREKKMDLWRWITCAVRWWHSSSLLEKGAVWEEDGELIGLSG